MKRIIQKAISTALISVMALSFESCSQTDVSQTTPVTEQSEQSGQSDEDPDVTTITFAVPEYCRIDDKNLKLFNDELAKDGYKYRLQVNTFADNVEDQEYYKSIENELKSGKADVAFLGEDDGSSGLIDLFNSGSLLDIDEVISSDKGKALYEAFPKTFWERVKFNGHTYSIPSAIPVKVGVFAAFNKNYVSDEVIENWDGSLEGIYKIIKNTKWDDEKTPRLQYLISYNDFGNMIGCDIQAGLLYDYDTLKIENPLESEKFINYFKVLEQMKSDGYLADSVSYYQNASYADENANLTSGKFLVVLATGEPDEYLLKNNIRIKQATAYLSSRINGSIGISKDTGNQDAVVDFLGILYSEEKYANILIYGKQDEEYKLADGFPVNMDGSEVYDNYLAKICLNLFINVHPVKDDIFTHNRKETFFAFYDDIKLSPFIGFEADYTGAGTISNDLELFMEKLSQKSLDEAVSTYSGKFKSDGIDAYIDSVKKQWDSFHQ